ALGRIRHGASEDVALRAGVGRDGRAGPRDGSVRFDLRESRGHAENGSGPSMKNVATPSSAGTTANDSSVGRRGDSRCVTSDDASLRKPVNDLAWSAERARAFGDDIVALWSEWLERLPQLPVAGHATAAAVRAAVTREIPSEPVPTDELLASLR